MLFLCIEISLTTYNMHTIPPLPSLAQFKANETRVIEAQKYVNECRNICVSCVLSIAVKLRIARNDGHPGICRQVADSSITHFEFLVMQQ